MNWQEVSGNWILVPPNPVAIVHFLGGAFVAAAPSVTYQWLLENLAHQGYLVVATPFINTFDHTAIAQEVLITFNQAMRYLDKQVLTNRQPLPIYGLGHSMGCKVHLLINSLWEVERLGNIYMSFNNYPARRSIPFLEQVVQFNPAFNVEFTPDPEATLALVRDRYPVPRNLLIKFRSDTIDQTRPLSEVLVRRFRELTTVQILKGSHTTPIAQEIGWQPGESFSPIDALGQFMKQEFYRDLTHLRHNLLAWLSEPAQGRPLRPL
ncbi:MAG: hypothetical protein DCF21_16790 [Leptolyngbya sp.]|jgi:hypothetical protein|uniref:DUF1350 domain-containing protein n=1 Tax=Shackletoniella antarctica TaxID=268115 RepID=A0A2W4VNH0_9CYAN|nr:MAG: hypothetical protein DCF17_20560 [Shackletoniella antarctica]PZV11542.1 MAG: hypothetical protein DCF21_16790 [Leptolyngbya sp.]